MSQKLAIVVAAAATAFVLVIGGAIMLAAALPTWAAQPSASTSASAASANSAADLATAQAQIKILQQRDQQYQQLLAQANKQLQDAYAKPTATPASPAMDTAGGTGPATVALSANDAAQIAASIAPGATLLKQPELVNLQGTTAYQVTFDAGMVYVDANSGQILGAVPSQTEQFGNGHHRGGDDDNGQGGWGGG